MPWVIPSEIFPQRYRAVGVTTAIANQWVASCVVIFTTPLLIAALGIGAVLFIYAALSLLGLAFVLLLVPETNGVGIDTPEMDALFNKKRRLYHQSSESSKETPLALAYNAGAESEGEDGQAELRDLRNAEIELELEDKEADAAAAGVRAR